MAASHTIDSLIAACNDCEVKYVGKITYIKIDLKKNN
jgi:hypothetical protein